MKTIHWGIIGPGNIAASFAKALNGLTENQTICAKLTAVASRNEKRSISFAKQWNFEKHYSDETAMKAGFVSAYEQLFADQDVDVVYIATPHRFHAVLSMQALRSGKHVLCEKPATVNSKELEQVIECAKKEHKFYMEALWTKFNPAIQTCLKWIEEGRIGDILHVRADFCFASPIYGENVLGKTPEQYDLTSRLFNPELAGGAFLDVGIYTIAMAMLVAGAAPNRTMYKLPESRIGIGMSESKEPCQLPKAIHAVARMGKTGIDLWNGISLRFGSEMTAQLSSSIDIGGEQGFQDAYIFGTKGKIKIPLFWMAQSIELYATEYNKDTLVEKVDFPFTVNGYEYEALHVMECLQDNCIESPEHTYTDMVNICHVLDECRYQAGLIFPFEDFSKKCNDDKTVNIAEKTGDQAIAQKSTGGEIVMYTDGACSGNPGPGGWGCVLIASGREVPLSGGEKLTTNNRMELMAAIQGFARIQSVPEWRVRPITVFIDSQYVKNGITKWISSWKRNGWQTAAKKPVKNRDLWVQLDTLTGELDVNWNWVKGHAGNKYNEICDQLAVKAGSQATQK
jgi:predicted dehydrogenase/ribonuclease HI